MKLTALIHAIVLSYGWRRWLIAFAAGAVSALAMAPFNAWPVLFLTFPILVWLIDGAGAGHWRGMGIAAATGWWFGFGYFLAGLYWVGFAFRGGLGPDGELGRVCHRCSVPSRQGFTGLPTVNQAIQGALYVPV